MRTTTTLTNLGGDAEVALADTFDPDQAANDLSEFRTRNDIDNGTATSIGLNGYTVAFNGLPSSYSRLGLGIFSGDELNSFFSDAPYDPDGAFEDIGLTLGTRQFLASGDSFTASFDQVYSLGEPFRVPEPATILGSFTLLGMGALLKRRNTKQQKAKAQ